MYGYYWLFFVLIIVCAVYAGSVQTKLRSTYTAMKGVPTRSQMTGRDTAVRLLRAGDVSDVRVGRVKGVMTDHYHPTKGIVNLSDGVYGDDSVAAVAIAAHEVGHVMQKKQGSLMYKLRSVLVPFVNVGTGLAVPLVLVGLLLDMFILSSQYSNVGFYVALAGVVCYGLSTLFALVTLPVEYDASRRAKIMLTEQGILTAEELPYAEQMLNAAAKTYVASLFTSLVYFLRFLTWVLVLFGRNRRD